jgi:Cysteine-rich secretory protein family
MRNQIKGIIIAGISICIIAVGVLVYSESITANVTTTVPISNNQTQTLQTNPQNVPQTTSYTNMIRPCNLREYISGEVKVDCYTHGLYHFKNVVLKTSPTGSMPNLAYLPQVALFWNDRGNYQVRNDSDFINLGNLTLKEASNSTLPPAPLSHSPTGLDILEDAFPERMHIFSQTSGERDFTTYPSLVNIPLEDINTYRAQYGLTPLSAGGAISPNLYAEELLNEKCIHHIDSKGQGPMLRYQTNGDKMFLVSENIAYETNLDLLPSAEIRDLDYQMMYNDSSENWGHKKNILDPNATSVSIGIAHGDNNTMVIVEDFEANLQNGYQYDSTSFQTQPEDAKHCWSKQQ